MLQRCLKSKNAAIFSASLDQVESVSDNYGPALNKHLHIIWPLVEKRKDKKSSEKIINLRNTLIENGIDSRQFKIEMELNSIEAIKNAVQSGLGAAFVSVSAISKELELNIIHWAKIKDITISRTLSIIVNPKRYYASSIKIFKREILDMFLVSSSFDNKLNLLWPEEEK